PTTHLYTLSLHDALPISTLGRNTAVPWASLWKWDGAVFPGYQITECRPPRLSSEIADRPRTSPPTAPRLYLVHTTTRAMPRLALDRKSTRLNSVTFRSRM